MALVWHRTVTDGNPGPNSWGNPAASLADLNLRLHSTEGFTLGPVVAESASSVDNLELIHQPALPPGSYALVVENTSVTSTPFAAAWHSLPAVSIAATAAEARETDAAPGEITITRSGDASLPLFVPLHTGGTAVAGTDFLPLPASVVIPAGETSAILPVIPISDNLATGDRSLSVSIATDFTFTRDPGNSAAIMIRDKPFDAWRFSKFSALELIDPAISSATADPDGDGLRNLVEFAFALEPETPDVSPLVVSVDSNHLVLSVTKNPAATDVAWAAEWSENLEQWFPATVSFEDTDTFIAADNSLETNLFRRFIRLRLIRQ